MNDNDLKNSSMNNGVYRATTNLNTALENPQVNINSVVGVNIQEVDNSFNLNQGVSNQNDMQILYSSVPTSVEYNQNLVNNVGVQNSIVDGPRSTTYSGVQGVTNTNASGITNVNNSSVFYNTVNDNFSNISNVSNVTNMDNNVQNQFISDVNNNGVNLANNVASYGTVDDASSYVPVSSSANYEPTMTQKKKPSEGLGVAKEVKAMVLIIFILMIFIFVIPYIYDFFKEMDLVITNG